eukprot:415093-Hanusia_phi.AAC.2
MGCLLHSPLALVLPTGHEGLALQVSRSRFAVLALVGGTVAHGNLVRGVGRGCEVLGRRGDRL